MNKNPEKLIKKGDKALKTGLLKWSKDYVSASMYYSEAAKAFKLQKKFKQAIETYQKLIPVNEKMNDNWGVAKNYENIIVCLFEIKGTKIKNE